jgi:hypothetical protein
LVSGVRFWSMVQNERIFFGMDSILIKKFYDRIYRINKIMVLPFQFHEETGNIQSNSSGITYPCI